ncbi:MAG: hypothetical protein U1F68_15390 [Gammaproteobacteria bacterium]
MKGFWRPAAGRLPTTARCARRATLGQHRERWLYASERLSNAQVSPRKHWAEYTPGLVLAYLKLLDATGKDCVLDSLIGEHGRKLQQAQEALKHCPPPQTLARSALVTAVERLRQDLQWLRDLQRRVC